MNTQPKPIAYYSIAGNFGIEIVNICDVDDDIVYRYTNDSKTMSAKLESFYDSGTGHYEAAFKDKNGTVFFINEFMRID